MGRLIRYTLWASERKGYVSFFFFFGDPTKWQFSSWRPVKSNRKGVPLKKKKKRRRTQVLQGWSLKGTWLKLSFHSANSLKPLEATLPFEGLRNNHTNMRVWEKRQAGAHKFEWDASQARKHPCFGGFVSCTSVQSKYTWVCNRLSK